VPDEVTRATREYLDTLDDAAFGAATPVKPKSLSPCDPAARLTAATGDRAFFAYSTNYLVDLENAFQLSMSRRPRQSARPRPGRCGRDAGLAGQEFLLGRTFERKTGSHPGLRAGTCFC